MIVKIKKISQQFYIDLFLACFLDIHTLLVHKNTSHLLMSYRELIQS